MCVQVVQESGIWAVAELNDHKQLLRPPWAFFQRAARCWPPLALQLKLESQGSSSLYREDAGTSGHYFAAFEAGSLEPELCNEKVRDLRARMEDLESEKQDLEARRQRLELPALDCDMLAALVDDFERVMAEGPNPKEKVLVHSRRTIEIWYALTNQTSVRSPTHLAPS